MQARAQTKEVEKGVQTPTDIRRLTESINELHRQAGNLADETAKSARDAIAAAMGCGAALIRLKKLVGHGAFQKCIMRECPNVTARTARKWMALAKWNHGSVLKDSKSLRQAYITCGIIPESKAEPAAFPGEVNILETVIGRIEQRLGAVCSLLDELSIEDLDAAKRTALKEDIAPLVKLWGEL